MPSHFLERWFSLGFFRYLGRLSRGLSSLSGLFRVSYLLFLSEKDNHRCQSQVHCKIQPLPNHFRVKEL